MMSHQGSSAELVGLPEEEVVEEESGSSSVMSFPRPPSPWLVNMAYKEFIGWDTHLAQIAPTSPPSPPNHHHQLPSSSLSNFYSYDHYDVTIWIECRPCLPPKPGKIMLPKQLTFEKMQFLVYFLDQGSLAEIVGLLEEEVPRPESWWLLNKCCQVTDLNDSQILPMSPTPPPNHHPQLASYEIAFSFESDILIQQPNSENMRGILKQFQELEFEREVEMWGQSVKRSMREQIPLKAVTTFSSFSHFRRNSNYQGDGRIPEVLQTTEPVVSAPVPKALPDGAEMMLDSSEQHVTVETHSGSEGGDVGTSIQSLTATSMVTNQKKRKLPLAICDGAKKEDLQQHSHKGTEEVARSPDACESTLEPPCAEKGISQWSESKDISLLEKAIVAEPSSKFFFTSPSPGVIDCSFGSTSSNGCSIASLPINGTKSSSFSHFGRSSNCQGDEKLIEVLQTTEPVISAPVPKALPDGTEMLLDSSEQCIAVETRAGSRGGDVGTSIQSLAATSTVNNQKKRKLPLAICDGAKKSVHLEDLQQHSHKYIEEVARSPDASESTLEPPCAEKGISQWSESKDISLLEKAIEAGPSSIASLPTNREEFSDMDEQIPSSPQAMQTSEPVISAPDQLETVPGVEVTIPSSFEQNSTVETHVENEGGDVGMSVQNLAATTMAKKQKQQKITPTKGGRSKKEVTIEDLHQFSHLSLKEAARSLGVSRSTLKRRCREMGISDWSKLKDIDVSKKSVEAGAYSEDVESIVIKVEYGNDIIKLKLSSSSKKADLEKEVATVLNLQVGSFRLKYEDLDGDWVILASDFNWQDCIGASRSLGKTTIKLLIS